MLLAAVTHLAPLGDRGFAFRTFGLGFLAVATYLALAVPSRLRYHPHIRAAQLAIGVYAIITSVVAGVFAVATALGEHSWFANDQLSNPSTITFLSIGLLVGGMLIVSSAQDLGTRRFNTGFVVLLPAWLMGIFSTVLFLSGWFGPSVQPARSTPGTAGTVISAALVALITAGALAASIWSLVGQPQYLSMIRSVLPIAVTGAAVQTALIAVRAPATELSTHNLYGVDLMVSGALIGLAVVIMAANKAKSRYVSAGKKVAPMRVVPVSSPRALRATQLVPTTNTVTPGENHKRAA